jgi:hypothetical protein
LQSVKIYSRRASFQIQKRWQKDGGQKNILLCRHSVIFSPPIFLPISLGFCRRPGQVISGENYCFCFLAAAAKLRVHHTTRSPPEIVENLALKAGTLR